jgi:hypothetical protein
LWDVMSFFVMLETARLYETSVHFCKILWYHILEDSSLHIKSGVHNS